MEEVLGTRTRGVARTRAGNPAYQAFQVLHWGFVALPAIAGIDKFTQLLTNWDQYLAPALAGIIPIGAHLFMRVGGVIEMLAALIVAVKPRVGAWVVAAWLCAIIVDLVLLGGSLNIALRDFGLMLGAISLARLSAVYNRAPRTA